MAKHRNYGHLRPVPTPAELWTGELGTEQAVSAHSEGATGFFGVPKPPEANTFGSIVSSDAQTPMSLNEQKDLFSPGSVRTEADQPVDLGEYDPFFSSRLTAHLSPNLEAPGELRYFPRHLASPDGR